MFHPVFVSPFLFHPVLLLFVSCCVSDFLFLKFYLVQSGFILGLKFYISFFLGSRFIINKIS